MSTTALCDLQYTLCMIVGASLQRGFRFKDGDGEIIDLTGYHAEIDVREKLADRDPLFTLDSDTPTAAGSTLTIDAAAGTILMDIVPEETQPWIEIAKDKNVFWDLRVTDADDKVTVYFRASTFTMRPVSSRIEPVEAEPEP